MDRQRYVRRVRTKRVRTKRAQRPVRRRTAAVVAFAMALMVSAMVPTLANADVVSDLLNNLGLAQGDGGSAAPATGSPGEGSGYQPPLHGSDPHGQGTDAAADLSPSTDTPLPGDPADGDEEVVVGDSQGSQDSGGAYHGNVTLLWLLGTPIVQVQTDPGESRDGPLQPLQDGLDNLCSSSNDQLCLTVLGMHSTSDGSGSQNSFELLGAHLGGKEGVNVDALRSNGNISNDSSCQTAHGDSSVADATAGGKDVAHVLNGSSDSTACSDGSQSVNQDSQVLQLFGQDIPIPAPGCADGTPNEEFTSLSPLVGTVCNADDQNNGQTSAPYGVREALTVFALISGDSSLLKATTTGPESHAVAPAATTNPPPAGPGTGQQGTQGGAGQGGNGGGNRGVSGGGGGAAGQAVPGNGALAFTGADLLGLGLVGAALILGGLALTTTGRGYRRTA
jgi:hypothetical protein